MKVGIGIIGVGTVGSGVLDIIKEKAEYYKNEFGLDLSIEMLCTRSSEKIKLFSELGYLVTSNVDELLENKDVQILVELAGGYDLPKQWIERAFENGKHVVTANKALIAKYGADLFPLAAKNNLYLLFEAAIGGGIPIIKAIQESLVGNKIEGLSGIINGTCNYILTEMTEYGSAYADVLKVAQEKGYAEADPEFDVEGIDSAHKAAILSSLCTKTFVDFESIYIEGISKIALEDLDYIKETGGVIKLLGKMIKVDNAIDVRVHPVILEKSHLLSNVNDVLNAVYLETNNLGPALFTGAGAGKKPTASAVVGDIIQVAMAIQSGNPSPIPMGYYNRDNSAKLIPVSDTENKYYLRFNVRDEAGVLASITGKLSELGISLETITQRLNEDGSATVYVVTHVSNEKSIQDAIEAIASSEFSVSMPAMIRYA